ncbi:hypothetical protein DIE07_12160 [Burkholderia sp. Bp9002]|nr:hypothetical protein DIE18_18545 [Burkholderia sp. Bp9125]RQS10936.1 hypothetical protein DIE07_12160 [Burkholderia sp. Bp9002]
MPFRPGTIRNPSEAEHIAPARASGPGRVELDPQRDRHARAALEAYADSVAAEMPWLAEWLRETAPDGAPGITHCAATVERVFDLAHAWAASQPDYAGAAWERVRGQLLRMLRQPELRQPAMADAQRMDAAPID